MSRYQAPLEEIRFVLFDLLGAEALFARLGHEDASRELVDAAMLILTIMLRPHGLFGRHDIERV